MTLLQNMHPKSVNLQHIHRQKQTFKKLTGYEIIFIPFTKTGDWVVYKVNTTFGQIKIWM